METLRYYNGSIFHMESNKIISMTQDDIPIHPFSEEALSGPSRDAGEPAGVDIYIVDNAGKCDDYRTNVFGETLIIPKIKKETHSDGLYVVIKGELDNFFMGEKQYEFYPMDELPECSFIHKDPNVALAHRFISVDVGRELKTGDKLTAYVKDVTTYSNLVRKEAEDARKKEELRTALIEGENRRLELLSERELSKADADVKMRHLQMKDDYEHRSFTRKDRSDIIKNAPTMTNAIAGVVDVIGTLLK